jgi:hypothetical protein
MAKSLHGVQTHPLPRGGTDLTPRDQRESAANDLGTRYREIAAWVKIAARLNHAGNPQSPSQRR